jgi:hypothetical protein
VRWSDFLTVLPANAGMAHKNAAPSNAHESLDNFIHISFQASSGGRNCEIPPRLAEDKYFLLPLTWTVSAQQKVSRFRQMLKFSCDELLTIKIRKKSSDDRVDGEETWKYCLEA